MTDEPEPYAIVVLVPKAGPGEAAVTHTVNGRVARVIAWLIEHRMQIEHMRGALGFNFGPNSFQAEIRETFPHEGVVRSALHAAVGKVIEATSTQTFAEEATTPSEETS